MGRFNPRKLDSIVSEWNKFRGDYPRISFNDVGGKRNKNNILFAVETANIKPSNYNPSIINQYKGYITWNDKVYNNPEITIPKYKYYGFPLFDNYYNLTEFKKYEDKIDGACLICRYRIDSGVGDITKYRLECLQSLQGLVKHCFGKSQYGGDMYKGIIGSGTGTYPSSLDKLKKLNEYKFNVCFENCYHELYSWDYITEKITDCFKAKTVPIYYGCYNIEDHIPKNMYVDFRDFNFDYTKLSNYLKDINKNKYEDMTESAFEWVNKSDMGSIKLLMKLLNELSI